MSYLARKKAKEDKQKETFSVVAKDNKELNKAYDRLFSTEVIGAEVLADLTRLFSENTSIKKGPDGYVDANATLTAAGAREVILYINLRIRNGQLSNKPD